MHTNLSFPESRHVLCGGNSECYNRSANLFPPSCLLCLALYWSVLQQILQFIFFSVCFPVTSSLMLLHGGRGADCCTPGLTGKDFWANCATGRNTPLLHLLFLQTVLQRPCGVTYVSAMQTCVSLGFDPHLSEKNEI